jgi:23S rRNA pseudouridine2605 synthase
VRVNGEVAAVGQTVDPMHDSISVDGAEIARPSDTTWVVLHKPPGVLTTARDERATGRRTVFDLVPAGLRTPGLSYVGRLDYMTEGVLLMTTDGAAAHRLTHPSYGLERTYVATVRGNVPAATRTLRAGVDLDDGPVRPVAVRARAAGQRRWELEITLTEGRTRVVRRVCEAVGLSVERLVRTRFGPITLGTLPPGAARALTRHEIHQLVAAPWPIER